MIELWRKVGFPGRGLYYGAKDKGFYIKGRAEWERDKEDGGYAADQSIDAVSVLFNPVCCILSD